MGQKETSGAKSGLRIASYNIRKCIGLDRKRRPGRTLDVINGLGADIVVLQEADRRLGDRPAALPPELIETGSDLRPVALGAKGSLGWHGNAVLLGAHLGVTARENLTLPGFEPRGAVIVDCRLGGADLRVVGLHLGLIRRHRQAQLQVIRRALDALDPMPTVILGDFNEWSPKGGFEPLNGDFSLHAPGLSFHAARPVAALDRIALSPGLALSDAGVVQEGLARRASDHLPVWADLSFDPGFGAPSDGG